MACTYAVRSSRKVLKACRVLYCLPVEREREPSLVQSCTELTIQFTEVNYQLRIPIGKDCPMAPGKQQIIIIIILCFISVCENLRTCL